MTKKNTAPMIEIRLVELRPPMDSHCHLCGDWIDGVQAVVFCDGDQKTVLCETCCAESPGDFAATCRELAEYHAEMAWVLSRLADAPPKRPTPKKRTAEVAPPSSKPVFA